MSEYAYFENWQTGDLGFAKDRTVHRVEDVDGIDVHTECGLTLRAGPGRRNLYGGGWRFPDHRRCGNCWR